MYEIPHTTEIKQYMLHYLAKLYKAASSGISKIHMHAVD